MSIPATIPELIDSVRALGATLGTATDELNARLKAVEAALIALKVGVRTEVEIDRGITLVFGKQKQWGLFVVHGDEGEVPLVNASREVRLLAAARLPELLAAMRSAVEQEEARVRKCTEDVDQILMSLQAQK